MDSIPPQFNPHLQRVLKSFQNSAVRSLSGPSGYASTWDSEQTQIDPTEYSKAIEAVKKAQEQGKIEFDPLLQPPPFPIQQVPVLIPMDKTHAKAEKREADLEGQKIACFVVGGEDRLCLPQILNTVLREYSLPQINNVCDELHIFCSRCNPEQLAVLKYSGILPVAAPSCGLITKTDAERLCSALIQGNAEKACDVPTRNSFRVYHECFGKCKGLFMPEMYKSWDSKCIECFDCHCMFAPQKFVCHSHKSLEKRTCHWGFDSQKWRCYLMLSRDQDNKTKLQEVLDDMKNKYDPSQKNKRKHVTDDAADIKRSRSADDEENYRPGSAFQPWGNGGLPTPPEIMGKYGNDGRRLPEYFHTGPPVLLNPERVVPLSESNRNDSLFAPNVCLAPLSFKKRIAHAAVEAEEKTKAAAQAAASIKKEVLTESEEIVWDSSDTESSMSENGSCKFVNGDVPPNITPQDIFEEQMKMFQSALNKNCSDKDRCLEDFRNLGLAAVNQYEHTLQAKISLEKELEILRLIARERTPVNVPMDTEEALEFENSKTPTPSCQ